MQSISNVLASGLLSVDVFMMPIFIFGFILLLFLFIFYFELFINTSTTFIQSLALFSKNGAWKMPKTELLILYNEDFDASSFQ